MQVKQTHNLKNIIVILLVISLIGITMSENLSTSNSSDNAKSDEIENSNFIIQNNQLLGACRDTHPCAGSINVTLP